MEHTPCPCKAYSTDLTDVQWHLLEPLVPAVKRGGRPAKYERREIINAPLYVTKNGCTWRNLPHGLPLAAAVLDSQSVKTAENRNLTKGGYAAMTATKRSSTKRSSGASGICW